MHNLIYLYIYKDELKNPHDDVISAVDEFLDQWDLNTATLMDGSVWITKGTQFEK